MRADPPRLRNKGPSPGQCSGPALDDDVLPWAYPERVPEHDLRDLFLDRAGCAGHERPNPAPIHVGHAPSVRPSPDRDPGGQVVRAKVAPIRHLGARLFAIRTDRNIGGGSRALQVSIGRVASGIPG